VGFAGEDRRTFLNEAGQRQFQHSLMICEALASIELAARAPSALRLIWWPEILERAPEATRSSPAPFRIPLPSGSHLAPDGLFGIAYGPSGPYRFFALEADRGTMPVSRTSTHQTSYLAKLAAYREIIGRQAHKTHWGIPNLLVLQVRLKGRVTRASIAPTNRALGACEPFATFHRRAVTDAHHFFLSGCFDG
jgi:hypothetical protein